LFSSFSAIGDNSQEYLRFQKFETMVIAETDVIDAAGYLAGTWLVSRRIRLRATGSRGCFEGTASFVWEGDRLIFRESGTLKLGGYEGTASQSYSLQLMSSTIRVYFANGAPFHEFELSANGYDVTHHCGSDRYFGRYRLIGPDKWSLAWHVRGRQKDYVMRTMYRR
jgi:uncharacterized protein DUF6314